MLLVAEYDLPWLIAVWQDALVRVLSSLAGPDRAASLALDAVPAGPEAWLDWASPSWCRLVSDELPGAVFAGCPQATLETLGRLASGDAPLEETDCLDTFLELVNQSALLAADAISARLQRRMSFSSAQVSKGPSQTASPVRIAFAIDGQLQSIILAPTTELIDALGPETPTAVASAPVSPPNGELRPGATRNLDLLMEVELPIYVTFGRTHLPLKDILKLSSGSIVELNRLVNEPVEVLINNSIIARGEVVVVDGNYGIRVTEIVGRQERIRSIL